MIYRRYHARVRIIFVKNDDGKYTEVTESQLDTALAEHEYSAVAETQSTCSKAGA